jgi:hypothetical protein
MESLKIQDAHLKVYTVDSTGITVKHFINPKLPTEESFPFENIKRDKLFYTNRYPLFLIVAGILLMILVAGLSDTTEPRTANTYFVIGSFSFIAAASFACFFLYAPKAYFLKTFNGKFIRSRVRKNENDISNFIDYALEQRDYYLNLRYGTPNAYLSYDGQYSNFSIMLKEKVITQDEFAHKIEALNRLFNRNEPQKIFDSYSAN